MEPETKRSRVRLVVLPADIIAKILEMVRNPFFFQDCLSNQKECENQKGFVISFISQQKDYSKAICQYVPLAHVLSAPG